MNYRKILGFMAIAGAISCATQAGAAVIGITLDTAPATVFQQTASRPCIIGENSCTSPLTTAQFPNGPQSTYDVQTIAYSVDTIRSLVTNQFSVGIDINTTTKPFATEYLDLFTATIKNASGGIVDTFTFDPATPGTNFLTGANGNGYSDAILNGFDLSNYGAGTGFTITFRTVIQTPTDGKEQFFLIAANDNGGVPPGSIPEPGTTAMLGLGLLGMGFVSVRGRKKLS
jgi:hypothetical protein